MAAYICVIAGLLLFQTDRRLPKFESVESVTLKMRQQLNTVKSMSVRYSVTVLFGVLNQERKNEGRIYLRRNTEQLRIEETDQTIIADGETIWTYLPSNRQVIVSSTDNSEIGTSPDKILFNYVNQYQHVLEGREEIGDTTFYVLKLTAQQDSEGIPELRIWVEDTTWLTKKVVYMDDMGSVTTLKFSDFQLNTKIQPELFKLTVPSDVEWVDLR